VLLGTGLLPSVFWFVNIFFAKINSPNENLQKKKKALSLPDEMVWDGGSNLPPFHSTYLTLAKNVSSCDSTVAANKQPIKLVVAPNTLS
jgi:hypothetical protein